MDKLKLASEMQKGLNGRGFSFSLEYLVNLAEELQVSLIEMNEEEANKIYKQMRDTDDSPWHDFREGMIQIDGYCKASWLEAFVWFLKNKKLPKCVK